VLLGRVYLYGSASRDYTQVRVSQRTRARPARRPSRQTRGAVPDSFLNSDPTTPFFLPFVDEVVSVPESLRFSDASQPRGMESYPQPRLAIDGRQEEKENSELVASSVYVSIPISKQSLFHRTVQQIGLGISRDWTGRDDWNRQGHS
jgi:hypothetical protein